MKPQREERTRVAPRAFAPRVAALGVTIAAMWLSEAAARAAIDQVVR